MKKIFGFVKGLRKPLPFTNRGAVIDKGSIYVVVILTLLVFGGYVFAGGTIPVILPKMSTELVNVLSPIREDIKSSLQLQTFYGVTPTPYPTPPPVPTAGLTDPKLIDCDRNIAGQNTPQLIWATKSDTTPASDNEEAIKIFYTGKDALLLGSGNVPSMVNSPSDRIANPPIGDQSARDQSGFIYYPALFITDITTNPGEARGDSQSGGQANKADIIYGTWKSRGVSNPQANNQIITPSQDAFPPVNGPPGPRNTDYSSEIIWKTSNLSAFNPQGGGFVPLVKGNKYRIQVVLHSGGDPEELAVSCFEWTMPGGVSPTPTPTTGGGSQSCANLESPPSMTNPLIIENVCPEDPGWPTPQQAAGRDVKIILPINRECAPNNESNGQLRSVIAGTSDNPIKNVWVVGGKIINKNGQNGVGDKGRAGLNFQYVSGTIFVEGIHIDMKGTCEDGINTYYLRGSPRMVVQNSYITGIEYCNPGTHGDMIHLQGTGAIVQELKLQNVEMQSVRQGMFVPPRRDGQYPGHGTEKLTLDHVFLQPTQDYRGGNYGAKDVFASMIYWAEGSWGPPRDGVHFNETYLKWWGGGSGWQTKTNFNPTIPNVSGYDANGCSIYPASAKVTGKWCAGDPPKTFVPLDKVGLNYNRDTFCTPAAGGGGNPGGNTGGENVAQGPQCSGSTAPPLARNAGFTKLAFCEDFSDPSRINLDGTLNIGQTFTQVTKGNIFGADKMPASAFSFANGIMSVKPTRNNYQVNFISTVPTGGGNFKGYAMRGAGWYTEIRWKHTNCGQSSAFPAFWSMDAGHLYNTGKKPFLEPDFYENIGSRYVGALHNWAEGGRKNASAFTIQAMPSSPTDFFTAGAISETGATGYAWHFNDRLMKREAPSWVSMFNNFVGPVMFGSGPNCPYDVDYVRVWTKSDGNPGSIQDSTPTQQPQGGSGNSGGDNIAAACVQPPQLSNPVIYDGKCPEDAGGPNNFPAGRDVLIKLPLNRACNGEFNISNTGNVHLIGGKIVANGVLKGINIHNIPANKTIFIEGVEVDGNQQVSDLVRSYNMGAGTTITVQNTLLHNQKWAESPHADCIHTQGGGSGLGTLIVQNVHCNNTGNNGFQIPYRTDTKTGELKLVMDRVLISKGAAKTGGLLNFGGTGNFGDSVPPQGATITNLYVDGVKSVAPSTTNKSDGTGDCKEYGIWNDSKISGKVCWGKPSAGTFAPVNKLGLNYKRSNFCNN